MDWDTRLQQYKFKSTSRDVKDAWGGRLFEWVEYCLAKHWQWWNCEKVYQRLSVHNWAGWQWKSAPGRSIRAIRQFLCKLHLLKALCRLPNRPRQRRELCREEVDVSFCRWMWSLFLCLLYARWIWVNLEVEDSWFFHQSWENKRCDLIWSNGIADQRLGGSDQGWDIHWNSIVTVGQRARVGIWLYQRY